MECIKRNGKLSSAEFIQNLDKEIQEYTQGYPQNDDITIVVIKEQKTDTAMMNKMEREIEKLRKKKMNTKTIEKKLGINLAHFKELKKEKKERGGKQQKLRFMTFEMKRTLMKVVVEHPEWSGSTYEKAMQLEFGSSITEALINNELKRVNLLTINKRKAYSFERKDRPAEAEKPEPREPKKDEPPQEPQKGGGENV